MPKKKEPIKAIRGKMVEALCEEQGISQKQLAGMLFLTEQQISRIINGKSNLTEDNARRIAELFPGSSFGFDVLMGIEKTFDSPLEYEKDWIRTGGGAHPLTNITVVEARACVALENMNKRGWQLAVNLLETLSNMPDLQNKEEAKK